MRLSVVIVNWNTRDFLCGCLQSLRENPPQNADMETIVVDNASGDGSAEMAAHEFPEVLLVANRDNCGYAEGNNQGMKRASGEHALLLNPDVIVHADSLSEAVQFMQTHPQAGALGGRLLGLDGETQQSVRGFPDPLPILWEYAGLARHWPDKFGAYRLPQFDYSQESEVDQPMGSFLLIRRAAWEQVGPMDTDFPIFFNEVDWCFRARRRWGWKIFYSPRVVVTHAGGASTRQIKRRMVRESHLSLVRFYEKHYRQSLPAPLFRLIVQAVKFNQWRLERAAPTEGR